LGRAVEEHVAVGADEDSDRVMVGPQKLGRKPLARSGDFGTGVTLAEQSEGIARIRWVHRQTIPRLYSPGGTAISLAGGLVGKLAGRPGRWPVTMVA